MWWYQHGEGGNTKHLAVEARKAKAEGIGGGMICSAWSGWRGYSSCEVFCSALWLATPRQGAGGGVVCSAWCLDVRRQNVYVGVVIG